MAHLWNIDDSGEWVPKMLDGDQFELVGKALKRAGDALVDFEVRLLLRRIGDRPETWALVADGQHEIRINGVPNLVGLTILADHDEIRTPGGPAWFFSTETEARVEPYPDAEGGGFCPRCKLAISVGTPAVRCPGCGLWYHQSEEFPCWTAAPQCAACPHPTELGAGFCWTPEAL